MDKYTDTSQALLGCKHKEMDNLSTTKLLEENMSFL